MAEPVSLEGEPVTLEQAKLNARVTTVSENDLIAGWIVTARRWVETHTGHILIERDVTEQFDGFGRVHLRAWPIAADAVPFVTYVVPGGEAVTVPSVALNLSRRPARVVPWIGARWPCQTGAAVSVTVRAGYASPADVPAEFKSAILLIVKGLYDERRLSPEIEAAARALCREYRLRRV